MAQVRIPVPAPWPLLLAGGEGQAISLKGKRTMLFQPGIPCSRADGDGIERGSPLSILLQSTIRSLWNAASHRSLPSCQISYTDVTQSGEFALYRLEYEIKMPPATTLRCKSKSSLCSYPGIPSLPELQVLSQETNRFDSPHPQHFDAHSAGGMAGLITGVDHFTSDQSRKTDLEQDGKNGYFLHVRKLS